MSDPQILRLFRLDAEGRSKAGAEDLRRLAGHFRANQRDMLGYQWSQDIHIPDHLGDFLGLHLDNIGDPMAASLTSLNTKFLEREVLRYFTHLWNAPPLATQDSDDDLSDPRSWGYVLSMGSTEGTLYALWNARDYLRGKPLHNPASPAAATPRKPLLFVSQEAHYSFAKAAQMVQLDMMGDIGNRDYPGQCPVGKDGTWPSSVPAGTTGGSDGLMDTAALAELVEFFAARGYAPVIVCNVGSTFKGALDDPRTIWKAIEPVLRRHDLLGDDHNRRGYWMHVDGALGAGYVPYLEMSEDEHQNLPLFDFRLPCVSSVVTSGHKWFGTPYPTGVYLTRNELRVAAPSKPGYVGSADTTIGGARDGLAPLLLWTALSGRPHDQQVATANRCVRLASYAHEQLTEQCPTAEAQRARNSLAIRFRRPADEVMNQFGLVGQKAPGPNGELREEAHLYVMPHVTEATINRFVRAISSPSAYPALATQEAL